MEKGRTKTRGGSVKTFFQKAMEDTIELTQMSHTRVGYANDQLDILSRLDRFYTNYLPAILMDRHITCQMVYLPGQFRLASDHIPVSMSWSSSAKPVLRSRASPLWVIRHPLYAEHVNELLQFHEISTEGGFEAITQMTAIFQESGKTVFAALQKTAPASPFQKFYWCLTALRAVVDHNQVKLDQCKFAYTHLDTFFTHSTIDINSLSSQLAALGRETTEKLMVECDDEPFSHPETKKNRKIKFTLDHNVWRNRSPGLILSGVRDNEGNGYLTAKASQAALAAHWSEIFAEKSSDQEAIDEILCHAEQYTHTEALSLNIEKFKNSILHTRNSAPGPDGIPYACWRACSDFSAKLFGALWNNLDMGGSQVLCVPPDFNHSFLYCLPKDDGTTVGDDGSITRIPSHQTTVLV